MDPTRKMPKVYLVETRDPIAPDAWRPSPAASTSTPKTSHPAAQLEILAERQARLTLHEGRYHQIKRMFHRVNNRVLRLHRESIGPSPCRPTSHPGSGGR